MRIVFITSGSGVMNLVDEAHDIVQLVRYLACKGHTVTVVDGTSSFHGRWQKKYGASIVFLPKFNLIQGHGSRWMTFFPTIISLVLDRLSYSISVWRYLIRKEFDIIHCFSPTVLLILILLSPHLRQRSILHSMVPARVGIKRTILDKVQLRVENCVARKVRLVILETELVRRQLIAEAKINANRTALIETGVNCQFWKPDSTLNHRIREQYKLGNKVIVLFQARIIERKGAEYLLKAAKVLIHERGYKNVAFLLVGPSCEGDEKPDLETPYLKRLRDFVKANNLDEYVRIVTGWLPTEEVRAFHSASDIYVLPTLSDLTPHSINEAMAMGKPIISTFVGGIPTQVEDGKNGFLVPPRDHYALANKLEILIKSQEIRRRMGIVSRMKALERSVEKKGQRIEKLYLEILSEIK